jgi:hypothetical protein
MKMEAEGKDDAEEALMEHGQGEVQLPVEDGPSQRR